MTSILLLFFIGFSIANGQNPKVKRRIEIVSTYNYNYSNNKKLYVSRKAKIQTDTIITEYNIDGTEKNYYGPKVAISKTLIKTLLVDEDKSVKHQREYFSDSTTIDIFTKNFNDSIIQIKISKKDTLQIKRSYFHKDHLVKSHVHYSKLPFGEVHEITTYDKNTRRREVATIVRHSNFSDNIKKIDNKKKKNIYKTLVFDSDKSEWYVVEKIKYQKSKVVLWETKFNKEHNMYFTTKITTTFNELNQPIEKILFDTYNRHIERKSTYNYEYY